jgi:hypothetical protein
MTDQSFLTLVTHLQRSNQRPRKESPGVQLDLFCTENETTAALAVLIIVDALLKADANLGTMKIQIAINKAREDVVALLNSQFPQQAEMRPKTQPIRQHRKTMEHSHE